MARHFSIPTIAIMGVLWAGAAASEGMGEHPHSFPKEIDAFHSELAPLWHSPAGMERSRKVCAKAPILERLAIAIPGGNTKLLLTSVAALKAQCQAGPANIDAPFSQVHEAFHRLIEHQQH